MASVAIKRGTLDEINNTPIRDGQILFSTDQEANRIYTDVGDERINVGGVDTDVVLTKAQYDALPDTKLTDGKTYYIIDEDDHTVSTADVLTTMEQVKAQGNYGTIVDSLVVKELDNSINGKIGTLEDLPNPNTDICANIKELNSNLDGTQEVHIFYDTAKTQLYKVGKVVVFNAYGTSVTNGVGDIDIPEGFRPKKDTICFCMATVSGKVFPGFYQVNTIGVTAARYYPSLGQAYGTAFTGTCHFSMSWIVE